MRQCAWSANIERHNVSLTWNRQVTMYVLDTDHLSVLERGGSKVIACEHG